MKRTLKEKAKKAAAKSKEKVLGKIEHIFGKINVITTTLKNPLKVGDYIHIKGSTTDLVQEVLSIQIEHEAVSKAKMGDGIGLKITGEVRDTDIIYLADKKTIAASKAPAVQPEVQNKPTVSTVRLVQPNPFIRTIGSNTTIIKSQLPRTSSQVIPKAQIPGIQMIKPPTVQSMKMPYGRSFSKPEQAKPVPPADIQPKPVQSKKPEPPKFLSF